MSVNYDKTIGVVVTPPTAATQGDQPASAGTTAAPPWIQVGPNRGEIQGHFKYLGSIKQGNGGQDREIQSRINTACQVFRSVKKSVHFQPRGLGTPNCTFTAAWCSHASCTGQQSHGPSRAPRLPNWRPSTTPACAA